VGRRQGEEHHRRSQPGADFTKELYIVM
jgi:hypothetical protein